jgi:4-amino-4-deoxy-L-arabinose transferase-like glycosyltransferase
MPEQSLQRKPYYYTALLLASVLFAIYLQFNTLSYFKIIQWDESRLAVNAAEMSQNGNWLITSFENQPDLYNTKPPLMIWLQTICIHLFGLNETAIRLPSALAGLICILLAGRIIFEKTRQLGLSALAIILLSVSGGFIQLHGSMTGDFDALLTLFVLLAFRAFEAYMTYEKSSDLLYLILWQSLAIMCKSAAGFISLPIWLMLLAVEKKWRLVPKMILAIALSLVPFIVYIFVREAASSGYLAAIWDNDFHGRFSKALEGHTSEWYYYIVNLFTFRYSYWIWLLPIGIIYAFFTTNSSYKRYTLGFLAYLTLLTIAKTRIHWYDMPLLPLLTLIIVFFLYEISLKIPDKFKVLYVWGLVVLTLPSAYSKYRFNLYHEGLLLDFGHYELSRMMEEHKGQALYIANWYDAEFYFYTKKHPNIKRGKFRDLQAGDTVLLGNMYKDSLPMLYNIEVLKESGNARTVRIISKKEQ